MKFLDSEKFNSLSSILSYVTSDCRLESKIELYSCKMVHQDKRMFKDMLKNEGGDTRASDLQALSTPVDDDVVLSMNLSPNNASGFKSRHTSGSSDADPDSEDGSPILCDAINRKRLFDLIGVLNASFADYDFTAAKGENFSKVASCEIAKRLIDSKYFSVSPQSYAGVQLNLWNFVNEAINLNCSKCYTYNPDYESDPYSEDGCIWSFNFFFYNPLMKRVLFFTCRAFSNGLHEETLPMESNWSSLEVIG